MHENTGYDSLLSMLTVTYSSVDRLLLLFDPAYLSQELLMHLWVQSMLQNLTPIQVIPLVIPLVHVCTVKQQAESTTNC